MPIRYPTSNATEDPRPRPGGLSSKGVSGWTRPFSSMIFWARKHDLPVEEQEPGQFMPDLSA